MDDDRPAITIFSPMFVDFSDEGRVEENHWYDTDHVPQRLAIPGFVSAARFERVDVRPAGVADVAPLRYINAYRITGPDVVAADPYLASYTHLTPRSVVRTFPVTPPHFRDVWTVVHTAGALASDDGVRTLLLVAEEAPADRGAARTFIRDVAVPEILTVPGVLRAFVLERTDIAVPLANGLHAPRFITAYSIASAESAAREEFGRRLSVVRERRDELGGPVESAWAGIYDRRPSAWTTRPA